MMHCAISIPPSPFKPAKDGCVWDWFLAGSSSLLESSSNQATQLAVVTLADRSDRHEDTRKDAATWHSMAQHQQVWDCWNYKSTSSSSTHQFWQAGRQRPSHPTRSTGLKG